MSLTLEIDGVEEVLRKLNDDVLLADPMRNFLNRMAFTGQAEARRHAKPHGADTGELANSVQTRLDSASVPLWAEVYTNKAYAASANYGRGPGSPPPVAAIEPWARRHGATGPGAAYLIARAIGRRGTKGLQFMEKARDEMTRRSGEFVGKLAAEVEAIWGKAA